MTKKTARRTGVMAAPLTADVLGPPALLDGENKEAYEVLHAKITGYVEPKDIIETMFVRDIIDLQWELLRWRRLKVALMNSEQAVIIRDMLIPFSGTVDMPLLIEQWTKQDPETVEALKEVLASKGVGMDAVEGKTLMRRLDHIERIDERAALAEQRRNRALRELAQHREKFAALMSAAIKEVEDAEFIEVEKADAA